MGTERGTFCLARERPLYRPPGLGVGECVVAPKREEGIKSVFSEG